MSDDPNAREEDFCAVGPLQSLQKGFDRAI